MKILKIRTFRVYNPASDKRRDVHPNSPFFPSPFTSLQMFSSKPFSLISRTVLSESAELMDFEFLNIRKEKIVTVVIFTFIGRFYTRGRIIGPDG